MTKGELGYVLILYCKNRRGSAGFLERNPAFMTGGGVQHLSLKNAGFLLLVCFMGKWQL
jgi:hypothetical protein